MHISNSTLIFRPEEQNLGLVDVTVRCLIGAEAWLFVAAAIVPTPQFVFAFSTIGFYLGLTAMMAFDPIYWLLQIRSVPSSVIKAKQHFWRRFLDYQAPQGIPEGASPLAVQPG